MAQRAHIPKFGNWEGSGNAPYTQYFDNARKGKTGKLINPNDPQENPEVFSEEASPTRGPPARTGSDPEGPNLKHERRSSREDTSDPRRAIGSPLHHEVVTRKLTSDLPHQRYGERVNSGEPQRRASRSSGGSDRSIEHSPLHPHYQAKSAGKGGVSSPSWEKKGPSEGYGYAPNTPGRSKLKPGGQDDDISQKGSTVPKFGAWDESNPASADGFTHIFDKVREEKHVGSTKVPLTSNKPSYPNGHHQSGNSGSVNCWCFSLGKS